jgi:hypothetical protein
MKVWLTLFRGHRVADADRQFTKGDWPIAPDLLVPDGFGSSLQQGDDTRTQRTSRQKLEG